MDLTRESANKSEEAMQRNIPRGNFVDHGLVLTKSLSPLVLAPAKGIVHPFSNEKRDLLTLRRCMMDNSNTFSLALLIMGDLPEVRDDLVITHQGYKILDLIDEKKNLTRGEKQELMNFYLNTVEYPENNIPELERRIQSLNLHSDKDAEHASLVAHIGTLIHAFQHRPQRVKDAFLRDGRNMAEGFKRQENAQILDMHGVRSDLLVNAGYVGYTVDSILTARGLLTEEEEKNLRPHARKTGEGVQTANNLRDLFKDLDDEIYHWPQRIIDAVKLVIPKHLPSRDFSKIEELYRNEFAEIREYTKKTMFRACDYIDELQRIRGDRPEIGHIAFTTLSLAVSAMTVRNVDDICFLLSRGTYQKPSKHERIDAYDVSLHLAKEKGDVRPYLEHILIKKKDSRVFRALRTR